MGELAGEKMKDLALFRKRPRGGPSASMMERAAARSSWEPQKVPSSRYHALMRRPGTDSLIFSMMGWRTREKPRGRRLVQFYAAPNFTYVGSILRSTAPRVTLVVDCKHVFPYC